MVSPVVVTSLGDYLATVDSTPFRLGLSEAPAAPWYLGQGDMKGTLLPALYSPSTKIKAEHEREILRDFKLSCVEFGAIRNYSDAEVLVHAQTNQLPTRILEWTSNPLFALFLAVEGLGADNSRVWVLNPWRLNALSQSLGFVPTTEHEILKKYVVKLETADTSLFPEAANPLAIRPPRATRNYSLQSVFWTVHGSNVVPIEELRFFLMRTDAIVTYIEIAKEKKKAIMRGLHDLGYTRAQFYPGLGSLVRTLTYRYSSNYID